MQVKTFANVTFEVTPRIAEKIAVAQSLGTPRVAAPFDRRQWFRAGAVAAGDVKVPAGASPAQEKQMLMAAANRPIDNNTTFSTGGDVSRFQRRSVPSKPQVAMAAPAPGAGGGATASASPSGVRVVRGNSVN